MTNLLTEAEAAEALRVCTRTLRRLRQAGSIRYVSITPRTILYRPEDLNAFIEQRSQICHDYTPTRNVRTNRKAKDQNVVSFTARRRERRGA